MGEFTFTCNVLMRPVVENEYIRIYGVSNGAVRAELRGAWGGFGIRTARPYVFFVYDDDGTPRRLHGNDEQIRMESVGNDFPVMYSVVSEFGYRQAVRQGYWSPLFRPTRPAPQSALWSHCRESHIMEIVASDTIFYSPLSPDALINPKMRHDARGHRDDAMQARSFAESLDDGRYGAMRVLSEAVKQAQSGKLSYEKLQAVERILMATDGIFD